MEYLDTVQDFKLEEIKKILIKNSDPFKIILFGSRSTGKYHSHSDYDICVIKESNTDLNTLEKKLYIDLHDTKEAIDLILTSPENFDLAKNKQYSVFRVIYSQGKIIYERHR
ncbi:MAG TPA: nucleotidyltransferase domain-containing protein [Leptospiraceae bacterium]|nr:nucleotidyltransferase domain-containing protein [Leptospiraceae bacterium]HRG77205.1 nucleotidyltransferase domain-containing protein [Leptospiraceae bacterium]